MKLKRIFAYIIDIVIVSFVSSLLFMLPCFKAGQEQYMRMNNEYYELVEEITTSGSSDVDEKVLVDLQYNMYKSSSTLLIIRLGVIIFYFGVIGFLFKGQTVGKKILGLRIVSIDNKNINPGLFMLREILVVNLIPELASLLILIICSKGVWLTSVNYLNYVSYITTFLLVGFMIFRDDERGLHDIICKTKVIDVKKNKVREE